MRTWTRHTGRFRYAYLAATAAMGVLLLTVSMLPHRAIEQSPYPQVSDLFDAANHFIGFSLFNFLLAASISGIAAGRALKGLPAGRSGIWPILFHLFIALSWGALCEGAQLLQAGRSFQLLDLAANLLPVPLFVVMLRGKKGRSWTAGGF